MTQRNRLRGQPLVALLAVLACWIGLRAMVWDAAAFAPTRPIPFALAPAEPLDDAPWTQAADTALAPARESPAAGPGAGLRAGLPPLLPGPVQVAMPAQLTAPGVAAGPPPRTRRGPWHRGLRWPVWLPFARPAGTAPDLAFAPYSLPPTAAHPARRDVPVRVAAAHQMMWMAMLSGLPVPSSLAARLERAVPPGALGAEAFGERAPPRRWSGDGWMFLRKGGGALPLAAGGAPSTYGASQAGAVLRYRLAPSDRRQPTAYLRTTAAMMGAADKDLALGLSARPLAGVPVVAAAELRVSSLGGGGTRLRPAAMVITELPPVGLPGRARAEAYLQAGYVAGSNATAFADGQVRVDRAVLRVLGSDLRAGGGVWGGVQKGASRLDIGPGATMGLPLGARGNARIAVDWRFRVAGDAAPSSGPSLTLSAGF